MELKRKSLRASFSQVLLVGVLLLLNNCVFETAVPAPHTQGQFEYRVQVAPLGQPGCQIAIEFKAWSNSGALLWQAPKYYTDNPGYPIQGFKAKDIQVRDAKGQSLVAWDTVMSNLEMDGNFIAMPLSARSLSYSIDFNPKDENQFGIPMPGIGPGVNLIDGAYYFILPWIGSDLPSQWRTPVSINLEFMPASGRKLFGTDAKVHFESLYGLMFVRGAYDPVSSISFPVRNHQVICYSTRKDSLDYSKFLTLLAKCIRVVEDSLLVLPTYRYFVGENPVFWGIEGTQGYWFKSEGAFLPALHVHELVHTFVGIWSGDYQDPWYKEGLTNYLGNLLSLQSGMISESTFTKDLIWDGDSIPAIQKYALASAQVRTQLFSPLDSLYHHQNNPEKFIQLVYGKGAQASMILDWYLLEYSQRRFSVFDLVRDLNKNFGPGFSRQEMVSLVSGYTQKNANQFLHDLLDLPGPYPLDSLNKTFSKLKKMGRFSPGVSSDSTPFTKKASGRITDIRNWVEIWKQGTKL